MDPGLAARDRFRARARRAAAVALAAGLAGGLAAERGLAQAVTITVSPASLSETAGATEILVTAEFPEVRTIGTTIELSLSGTAGSGDYSTSGNLRVTVPSNARSGNATFTVTPVDDRLLEGAETIVISGAGLSRGAAGTGTITLQDDEAAPEVILTATPGTVREDDTAPLQVTVSARLAPDLELPDEATVVTLSLGGSASAGDDYSAAWDPTPPRITIPRGQRDGESAVTLALTPKQDAAREGGRDDRRGGRGIDRARRGRARVGLRPDRRRQSRPVDRACVAPAHRGRHGQLHAGPGDSADRHGDGDDDDRPGGHGPVPGHPRAALHVAGLEPAPDRDRERGRGRRRFGRRGRDAAARGERRGLRGSDRAPARRRDRRPDRSAAVRGRRHGAGGRQRGLRGDAVAAQLENRDGGVRHGGRRRGGARRLRADGLVPRLLARRDEQDRDGRDRRRSRARARRDVQPRSRQPRQRPDPERLPARRPGPSSTTTRRRRR